MARAATNAPISVSGAAANPIRCLVLGVMSARAADPRPEALGIAHARGPPSGPVAPVLQPDGEHLDDGEHDRAGQRPVAQRVARRVGRCGGAGCRPDLRTCDRQSVVICSLMLTAVPPVKGGRHGPPLPRLQGRADTSGASHDGLCAGLSGGHDYRPFGSGRWIRTADLVVMSHASL